MEHTENVLETQFNAEEILANLTALRSEMDEEETSLELQSTDEEMTMVDGEYIAQKYPTSEELEYPQMEHSIPEELLWQARTGLNPDTLCGAIETIIFMNDKPVSILKIKALIDEDMPLKVIHEALQRLQAEYEEKHHGIRLLEVAEGYQYRTKATYSKYVQDIFKINSLVLSPTALEVLAIIAYKQPVSKTEVDKIRGVDSGHIVRALMDKRLVKVAGRSEEVGRPVLYATTPEFLEVFNLADLSALPPEHELESMSLPQVGKIADIKTLVHSGDKEKFKFDELHELDELSEAIKNIASDTDFTASLKVEEKKRISAEGEEVKSAFDLLEEFVNKRLAVEQNKSAVGSQLMGTPFDVRIVEDLEAGPHNAPNVDEDFQMIDLETGLPIEELEASEEGDVLVETEDGEFDYYIDLEFDTEETEEEALSKALDAAFENLTGEKLSNDFDTQLQDELDEHTEMLDHKTDEVIERAQDLDLDLSFLKDSVDDITFDDELK